MAKVTCPICGNGYRSLSSHVRSHGITTAEFREHFPNAKLVSDETKELCSETCKENNVGSWKKGSVCSEEHKRKISIATKGERNPFFGKKHSEKTRKRMSENHADFTGVNNPFKNAIKDPEFRESWLLRARKGHDLFRSDPNKVKAWSEKLSASMAQAYIDGKLDNNVKNHKSGHFATCKSEKPIFYRSSYELSFLQKSDSDDSITSVNSPKFRIPYCDENGNNRNYIPDFVVNDNLVVEIKAEFALSLPRTKAKFSAAHLYCADHGLIYKVLYGPDLKEFQTS